MATSVQKSQAAAPSTTDEVGSVTVEKRDAGVRVGLPEKVLGGRGQLQEIVDLVLPVSMALVAVVAGLLAVQRTQTLMAWEETFTGSGSFIVTSCEQFDRWGPDQWHCQGRLTVGAESSTVQQSTMAVSRGAMPSFQPYVGQRWDVFFEGGGEADDEAPDFVYADQLQLSEIARLYISIFPRVMLSVGAAGWVAGWWFKRRARSKPDTWWVNRLPGMQSLQRRSSIWIAVAFAVYVVYRLIAYYVLGSVGVA